MKLVSAVPGALKYDEEYEDMHPITATRTAADAIPTSKLIRRKFPRPALNDMRRLRNEPQHHENGVAFTLSN
jgi:hypothetical protein